MAQTAIIISVSSDMGASMAEHWLNQGSVVYGTFRTASKLTKKLEMLGVRLIECDLEEEASIEECCTWLESQKICWDVLVLCPGTTEPIGPFAQTAMDLWENSVVVNFINQIRIVHRLLPLGRKNPELEPCVLFIAGGGVNNATVNYSAYTISKIALIKMCELLHAEVPDTRFAIVGPGWVKTKIHEQTLRAGILAGDNLGRTKEKLKLDDFTSMDDVLDCIDWMASMPRQVIGGRNISVAHDAWGTDELQAALLGDPELYKLRRNGNDYMISED